MTLVGGKGGVGKTTCAAALALDAARRGLRTLIVTTDPAPSLADAFRVQPSSRPRRIPLPRGRLFIQELDAPAAFERWLAPRRPILEGIASGGTLLDHEDVTRLLRLSLPGIDEVMAVLEILALADDERYEAVIVDTAPTGHTLRLLALPALLGDVAAVFDAMHERQRALIAAIRGAWEPDRGDALIRELSAAATRAAELLRDQDRTALRWVTLPELLAVQETLEALAELRPLGLPPASLIANRVTSPPPSRCARCDARRQFERGSLRALERAFPNIPLASVAARPMEPRGLRSLGGIARELCSHDVTTSRAGRGTAWAAWSGVRRSPAVGTLVPDAVRLLMFGGKGGVGKTTCAASAALWMASANPARTVLLVSSDPAHSQGHVFGQAVGDEPVAIRGGPANLLVRELDAPAQFARVRARSAAALEQLYARLTGGLAADSSSDARTLSRLLQLAPPGIDEIVAVAEVAELLERPDGPHRIVLDLAPSGHALRLLETPELVQEWVKALMSILLKYRQVVGIGDAGALLLDLSRRLGRFRELLVDPERCRFLPVARAAALPRLESARLLRRLRGLGIPLGPAIVNSVGHGDCARCRRGGGHEARELRALAAMADAAGTSLLLAPEAVPPPAGPRRLRAWAATWRPPQA